MMGSSTKQEPIEGAVAQVLNARELVINRGRLHGVTRGACFSVLSSDRRLVDIKDPDTKEVLGSITREVLQVKVVDVLDNMCIAKTFDSYTTSDVFSALALASAGKKSSSKTYYQTLKKSREYSSAGYEDLRLEDSAVQIGDRVVQVLPEPAQASGSPDSA
jgi:hypothetical protein